MEYNNLATQLDIIFTDNSICFYLMVKTHTLFRILLSVYNCVATIRRELCVFRA